MDFVIVGIVIGAVLVGAGALLRDLGPRFRPRIARPDAADIEPDWLAFAWSRYCQSLGMAITSFGFLIVVATVAGFFVSVSDRVGWSLVGVATVIGLAGTVVSSVMISRHYRRGGFDPRPEPQPETTTLAPIAFATVITPAFIADRTVPLASVDPFEAAGLELTTKLDGAVDGPAIAQPPDEYRVDAPPVTVAAPEESIEMERNDDQVEPSVREMADLDASALSEPTALPDEQPLEPVDPAPERYIAVEPEPKPDLSLPYPAETWQPPDREWVEPYVPAQASMPVLSGFEPPLIDPDDDLPAWGGPPVERLPEPVPYAPPAPPSSGDTFQSSLLADLKPETAQGEELAGPFKSRLLNELTSARNEAEPGGNDVLIAETPAVDPDRGARSE